MNIRDLVERSIEKAGGVRALSRALDWDAASIVKARDDSKLSPYRAARLASFLDDDVMRAVLAALSDTSKSEAEASYWIDFPSVLAAQSSSILMDALVELERRLSAMKHKPNPDEKAKMIGEVVRLSLTEAWTTAPQLAPLPGTRQQTRKAS